MKQLCVITLAILCLGVYQETDAEIRNGYDSKLIVVERWLHQLHAIARESNTEFERDKMKSKLEAAQALVDKIRENYVKTQEIIELLRLVDPTLYEEINTIRNCEGNVTHVYIKVVDKLSSGLYSATNVSQSNDNPNVYSSEYGDHTVSVKIAQENTQKGLWSLVHELGHVRYQVPHLAEYMVFYEKVYQNQHFAGIQGHHPNDPGAYAVQETLKAFKQPWKAYNKEIKQLVKGKSRGIQASKKND